MMNYRPVLGEIDPLVRDIRFGVPEQGGVREALDRLRDAGRKVAIVNWRRDRQAFAILGYETVQQLFQNEAEIPGGPLYQVEVSRFYGQILSGQTGSEHRWHRAMFGAPLIPSRVRTRVESALLPLANDLIDRFADRDQVDFVAMFAHRYPFDVISELLDIPRDDREGLRKTVKNLFEVATPAIAEEARDRMVAYLRVLMDQRRRNPGEDILSALARSEVGGRRYTDVELCDAVRFLYPVSGENTMNALGTILYYVLSEPGVYDRLKANPKDRSVAVEESLRIHTPLVYQPRYIEHPITVDGFEIPANSYLLLATSSANRDPAQFDNPAEFSLDRGPINHLTFGTGPHFCLGAHVARAEARAMLDVVIERLPGLRLVRDQEIAFYGSPTHGLRSLWIEFDEVLPVGAASPQDLEKVA